MCSCSTANGLSPGGLGRVACFFMEHNETKDYRLALKLYERKQNFKTITDQIYHFILDGNHSPNYIRNACELAILKAVQERQIQSINKSCPQGLGEILCETSIYGCGNIYCDGPKKKDN